VSEGDVSIKITLFGDEFFKRRITATRYRARDFSSILEEIGEDWIAITEEQFATEGGRSGNKWEPLARDTYLRRGSKHPILVESGDLLIEMSGPDNISVDDMEVTMTIPEGVREKAEAHQYGFTNAATGRPVPARKIVDFTAFDREHFQHKIQNWLVNGDR
jgi:hypothetical protein